ncbi:MAG: hypothetical protein HeimC2_37070 [Candidatus Heimdallarchaeota archaeon LC_2]|nr:MAG: hypothetical protein HeimC2_37070 [Candidatus Heimdallarchaeota archaeon LC_2]
MYFDASAFHFFFRYSKSKTELIRPYFQKLQEGKITGITSSLTFDELYYTLLMRLIEEKYSKHPSQVLRENKYVIKEFSTKLKQVNEIMLSFNNLQIILVDKNIVGKIPLLMVEYNLLPRDCIHLQTMINNSEKEILSTDGDFDGIAGIKRVISE